MTLFLALVLAGCGSGIIPIPPGGIPTSPDVPQAPAGKYVTYHAYGDSITAGAGLSDAATQAYPELVGMDRRLVVSNYALNGAQACDVAARQIFAYADRPSLVSPPLFSLLIGTNDVNIKGAGPYEAVFNLCQQAAIAWLAVPSDFKVLANSANVIMTGGGDLDLSNNWNAWQTTGLGSSVSFTITMQHDGPIYAWPLIDDKNPSTYTYSLDGIVLGTGHTQTTPAMSTHNGTTNSLGFLRLPAVSEGRHIVTFTQTSTGSNGISIVGIGSPPAAPLDTLPTVLVGTVPAQMHGGAQFACTSSDAPCLQYIQDIEANVKLFANDNLDVRLFDTRKYMSGTWIEMTDPVHPNARGEIELSHAVEASF
ncbi:MAG TPA: SGNH/GDSL hydrolase family protein [Edaphobacter sp.]|nr:SGNH/GDSL hydrolase family protein [Edaphobacter sp.]